jgi:gamma-glutamylcysteine synthetase
VCVRACACERERERERDVPGLVKVGACYIRGCWLLLSLQGAAVNVASSFAQAVRTVGQKENCDLKNHIFPFSR